MKKKELEGDVKRKVYRGRCEEGDEERKESEGAEGI